MAISAEVFGNYNKKSNFNSNVIKKTSETHQAIA